MFLRACGFATTARPLVIVFPRGDESLRGRDPWPHQERSPSPDASRGREDAHRLLQYEHDARATTANPSTPAIGNAPGHSSSPLVCFEETCGACGPAGPRDCSRAPIWTGFPGERTSRTGRNVTLLRDTRAPPVALSWLAARSKNPVLPGAPRPGFPAPSRKGALPHEPRCIPPSGPGYSRRDRSHPVAPAGLPLWSTAVADGEGRTGARCDRSLAFTLNGWRRGSGPATRPEDDVRPLASRPKRP